MPLEGVRSGRPLFLWRAVYLREPALLASPSAKQTCCRRGRLRPLLEVEVRRRWEGGGGGGFAQAIKREGGARGGTRKGIGK
jgi:hypothetical protein